MRNPWRGGLPAFRRLIGRPILSDVFLQDVIFVDGREVDSLATAKRASVTKLTDLGEADRLQEKADLKDLREGSHAKGQYEASVGNDRSKWDLVECWDMESGTVMGLMQST